MTPGAQERAKTANECLSNRIMALRETRCEAHKHYLCDTCAGQWITGALAQAVQGERERWATELLKTRNDGGKFYAHACTNCGLSDEEWAAVDAEHRILQRIAAALRARPAEPTVEPHIHASDGNCDCHYKRPTEPTGEQYAIKNLPHDMD